MYTVLRRSRTHSHPLIWNPTILTHPVLQFSSGKYVPSYYWFFGLDLFVVFPSTLKCLPISDKGPYYFFWWDRMISLIFFGCPGYCRKGTDAVLAPFFDNDNCCPWLYRDICRSLWVSTQCFPWEFSKYLWMSLQCFYPFKKWDKGM